MQYWIVNVIIVFFAGVLFARILIPKILTIAFRRNLFDRSDERKVDFGSIPRLGGLVFYPVITFSLVLMMSFNLVLGHNEILTILGDNPTPIIFLLCALLLLYLIGVIDDLVGVRYTTKFVFQILSSVLLIISGIRITSLGGLLGLAELPMWLSWCATIFMILFIVNAFNLIDGIDGLASGLSAITLFLYGIMLFIVGEYLYAFIAVGTLGVLVPFFYYNVFGKVEQHKKIFMGDTGSLTIGFILSLLFVKLLNVESTSSITYSNQLLFIFSPLLIPCFDVVRVVIHRLRHHKNPFLADRNHIHHKLLALGLTARQAMIVIIISAIVLIIFNFVATKYINVHILLLFNITLYSILNIYLTHKIKQ